MKGLYTAAVQPYGLAVASLCRDGLKTKWWLQCQRFHGNIIAREQMLQRLKLQHRTACGACPSTQYNINVYSSKHRNGRKSELFKQDDNSNQYNFIMGSRQHSPYVGMARFQNGGSNQCIVAFSRQYHRRRANASV